METKHEHTPGPWQAEANRRQSHFTISMPGRVITVPVTKGQDWDETAANARLIAAAPQLLAACHRARMWFEDCGAALCDEDREVLQTIDAAIVASEGNDA